MSSNASRPSNRLQNTASPYLRQHAHNPVNWYPWGEEAFTEAKKTAKPIFLSIGYSTCHWCHVMARESFTDPLVARFLNEHFISIKVDREERPDVDAAYMQFVVQTTGHGGWPLSVFLTPQGRPLFGGTYFPPVSSSLRGPSFLDVARLVMKRWTEAPNSLQDLSKTIQQELASSSSLGASSVPEYCEASKKAIGQLVQQYEPKFGGFGDPIKFPQPSILKFLLSYHHLAKDSASSEAYSMAKKTILSLLRGGIHDFLGGGFHRYSTDREFHVPHFEKMLYDQGQLLSVFSYFLMIEKEKASSKALIGEVETGIYGILKFLKGNLLHGGSDHGESAFYSAIDADSIPHADMANCDELDPHSLTEEGAFYVWTMDSLTEALDEHERDLAIFLYDIRQNGNTQAPEFQGKNVLIKRHSEEDFAAYSRSKWPDKDPKKLLKDINMKLEKARQGRPSPGLDDKIITAWNAYVIRGLLDAFLATEQQEFLDLALATARFVLNRLTFKADDLLKLRRVHGSQVHAFSIDYAAVIEAFLQMYQVTFDEQFVMAAISLQKTLDQLFIDTNEGGYFGAEDNDPAVFLRTKETTDGAEPSPLSLSLRSLAVLLEITGEEAYKRKSRKLVESVSLSLEGVPSALPLLVSNLPFFEDKHQKV